MKLLNLYLYLLTHRPCTQLLFGVNRVPFLMEDPQAIEQSN